MWGCAWRPGRHNLQDPLAQPCRDCSQPAPPWFHPTKRLPPFPRKFTWQTEAGSTTETITEPDNSDALRPNSLTSRVKLGPALVAVPLWLLKWCWASMSLVELAPLWGERYIIRNQGAQSIPTGHWWALGVTGKMSRCQGDFRVTPGLTLSHQHWASQCGREASRSITWRAAE